MRGPVGDEEAASPSVRPVERILVIRLRYLGDLVLTQALLAGLRTAYPRAQLTMATDAGFAGFVRDHGLADEVLPVPRHDPSHPRAHLAPWPWIKLVRTLRNRRFDLVLDAHGTRTSSWLARLAGGTRTPSIAGASAAGPHMLDRFLGLLPDRAGRAMPPRLRATLRERQAADALLATLGLPQAGFALIHPGSRVRSRRWPAERFSAVIEHLWRRHGLKSVVIGGPGELALCRWVAEGAADVDAAIAGDLSVGELIGLCERCAIYIGNDTGPTHVAAATPARTITLFGLQSPELWAPLGPGNRVLRAAQPCGAACLHPERCRPPDVEATWCVGRISVEDALGVIDGALAGARAAPAPIRNVS